MQLVSNIEIGYFRSIYKVVLPTMTDLNIFFGRNDSGKSNILRALNLFFNGETNPGTEFDFLSDFCHARLEETQKADTRKSVYIKITFNTPKSWIKSLGENFYVKKSWSIQRKSEASFESSVKEKGKQIYLTRFLNSVRFIYVPAIKDRTIFSDLFSSVYRILSKDVQFNESLVGFASEIEKNTQEISSQIFNSLALKSNISPPSDLTVLFKSLDFDTTNATGDKYSLTRQHGDGIQVRHIPALLAFISDRDDFSFNIWGFEEPENSLELAAAFSEAQSLLRYSRQANKQVFVTSHSPAFFSLNEKNTSRSFVFKESQSTNGRTVSKVKPVTDSEIPSEMMGETPFLPVISNYLKEYDIRVKQEQAKVRDIEKVLSALTKPILFVEGEADRILVQGICNRLYPDGTPFDVRSGDGTMKMESLAKDGKALMTISSDKRIAILVDNDLPGRTLLSNARLDGGGKWVKHNSNHTFWCRLPFSKEFITEFTSVGIPKNVWPGVMENCFSKKFRQQAIIDGAFGLSEVCYDEILKDTATFTKITHLFKEPDERRMYFFSPDPAFKESFSKYVLKKTVADTSEINWLIEIIENVKTHLTE